MHYIIYSSQSEIALRQGERNVAIQALEDYGYAQPKRWLAKLEKTASESKSKTASGQVQGLRVVISDA